jgi:UPF0716 family protein affecting phage T7 exclusion
VVLKIVRVTLGVLLCIAGVILGPVPIVPGFVFFGAGLALLARDIPWVHDRVQAFLVRVRALRARWKRWRRERRERRGAKKSG